MNQYETVFILTPVLSDVQMKEAVEKFKGILTAEGLEKAGLPHPKKVNWFLSVDRVQSRTAGY